MTGNRILLAMNGMDRDLWARLLAGKREIVFEPDGPDDPSIRFAVVWKHRPRVLEKLPNLKVIFSAGAGVDHLANDPGLPELPIVRVIAGAGAPDDAPLPEAYISKDPTDRLVNSGPYSGLPQPEGFLYLLHGLGPGQVLLVGKDEEGDFG